MVELNELKRVTGQIQSEREREKQGKGLLGNRMAGSEMLRLQSIDNTNRLGLPAKGIRVNYNRTN